MNTLSTSAAWQMQKVVHCSSVLMIMGFLLTFPKRIRKLLEDIPNKIVDGLHLYNVKVRR
jgi:hypothetical protein